MTDILCDKVSWLILVIGTWLILTVTIFLPHVAMLRNLVINDGFSIGTKTVVIIGLYTSLWTNFNLFNSLVMITLSLLFGLNLVLITWLFRVKKVASLKSLISSGSGTLFGLLGVGCATCGSIALSSFLPFFVASGLMTALPLGGLELQVLAIVLLIYSGYRLVSEIKKPMLCQAQSYGH